jgi:hypothetical protein
MRVVKRNKRLWIDDEDGTPVYTPPNFIRLQTRDPLQRLANALALGDYIGLVMKFETEARGDKR